MIKLKTWQNTLLVTTTQLPDEIHVDSDYRLKSGLKLLDEYKILLSSFIYENEKDEKNLTSKIEALTLSYNKVLEARDLKLQIQPSEHSVHLEKMVIKEIIRTRKLNEGVKKLLQNLSVKDLPYFRTIEEYFGRLFSLTKPFKLGYVRRKKRNHFEKYIGVGYKDKGAASFKNIDGSPSWQEITSRLDQHRRELTLINKQKYRVLDTISSEFVTYTTKTKDVFSRPIRYQFKRVMVNVEDQRTGKIELRTIYQKATQGFERYFKDPSYDEFEEAILEIAGKRNIKRSINPYILDGQLSAIL